MANSSPDPSTCVLDAFRSSIAERVAAALPPLTVEQVYSGEDYGKKEDVGAKVIAQFQPDDYIESLTLDKAFLHFQCKSTTLIRDVLTHVQVHNLTHLTPDKIPCYGSNSSGQGKKVVIEYSSPNTACGWEVISKNYLGDWGTQHLFDIYVKVNKNAEADPEVKAEAARWFKRMEDGDKFALKNWRVWRALSVKKYTEEYDQSMVGKEWQDKALTLKMGKAVLRNEAHGASIYLIRDIGGAIKRCEKYKFDKMIYIVLVQGMSTCRGTIVFLDEIIREAGRVMHEQAVNREIGITGVKIQDMAAKRYINNYTFNWDRMKSFDPYLQYAHVRLSSISRKNPHLLPLPPPSQIDTSSLATSSHARDIVFLLGTYSDIVEKAALSVKGEEDLDKACAKMWMCECEWDVLAAATRLLRLDRVHVWISQIERTKYI
ncbi:hypothetical protein B0H11DRAFT_2066105 [Mycena galericulata]|nr:hypothetical protein B0H11DRAFT_2066105 [Mycena galericulata]